jgi:hypothetical protein
MAKDKRDGSTRDWVDDDEERRFKEERSMVRDKLRQEKYARRDSEKTETTRPKPRAGR